MTMLKIGARLLGALILLFACAQPAAAQWPTVIMFYGGELKQPVFATGGDTPPFGPFVNGPAVGGKWTGKDMGNRPFVGVAFFWGPRDEPAHNGVRTLTELRPEMSFQHGRLYPAVDGNPPMLLMRGLTSLQIKGRDLYGMLKVRSADGVHPTGRPPTPPPTAVPTDPAAFNVGGPVPESALAVLKRLGVIRQ